MIKILIHFLLILLSTQLLGKEVVHYSFLQYMPPTLDPVEATETNSQFIINNSFDGLVSWGHEKGLVPQLAKEWIFSKDKTKIKFILRDAMFTDGTALESKDILNHFERLKKSPYFKSHFSLIKKINLISKNQVEFVLKNYTPHFLHLLSGTHSKIVKFRNGKIMGIGPFKPEYLKDKVILTKNNHYWGPLPSVDIIELNVMSVDLAMDKMMNQEMDDMILNPGTLKDFQFKKNNIDWHKQPMWATWGIALDQKLVPVLSHRLEIINALKTAEFIKIFSGNLEAYGVQAFGMPGYLEKPIWDTLPPLLKPDGQKQKVKIYLPIEVPSLELIEKWILSKKLNCCTLLPVRMEFVKIIDQVGKGKLQSLLISFNPEYPDPGFLLSALHSGTGSNYLNLSDPAVDNFIQNMNEAEDSLLKSDFAYKVNSKIMKDARFIPYNST
jgi:ABC-type transport system substrate-binding protein